MKNAIKALVLVALFAIAGIANAQNSASTNGTATARIIRPVTITKNTNLNFGNVLAPNSGTGTVVVSPAGTPTYTPAGIQPGTQGGLGGAITAGQFTVTGEPGFTLDITRVTTGAAVGDGLGHTMALSSFTTDAGANPVADATGSIIYHVGATLSIPAGQAIGQYSTTASNGTPWTETVAYH